MIDIESKVFDTVYTAVTTEYPAARVDSGYVETPASFPAVSVEEIENAPVRRLNTDDCSENATRLLYEVNVRSNKQDTAKSEAKTIFQTVDAAMKGLKFYRTTKKVLPAQDRTVCRLYARYEVLVGEVPGDGENTVYQFYRR